MNILQDYYESKLALDILAKEVEEKKQAVVDFLKNMPDNKTEIVGAKFHLKKEFTYEFSDELVTEEKGSDIVINEFKEDIKMITNRIKNMKAVEIENGTAKLLDEETKYIPVMTIKK